MRLLHKASVIHTSLWQTANTSTCHNGANGCSRYQATGPRSPDASPTAPLDSLGATARAILHFRIALCLLAVIAVMLVVGCGNRGGPGSAEAEAAEGRITRVSVIGVQKGKIADEIELTGTCEAYQEADVVPEVSGKVSSVAVDLGDQVSKGDQLVRLDTSIVSKRTRQAQKQVSSARAMLDQAQEGARLTDSQTQIEIRRAQQGVKAAEENLRQAEHQYDLTKEQVQNAIEQAKVGLATAQAQKREVFAGARIQEIAQAEAAVRQAESDVALKKSNYNRYKRLYEQGAVAEATLDQYRTQYEVAQQSLQQAREALSLTRAGARQEQRQQADLRVQQAQEQLRLAEARRKEIDIAERGVESARIGLEEAKEALNLAKAGRRQYDVRQADVKAARAGVESAGAARDLAQTTENKYTIVAPIAGRIARRNVDVGEGASPSMPVMRIVDMDPILVNCNVSELDISKIRVGDGGVTRIDGLPGKEFYGTVVDISPQAKTGQRTYVARVEIDNPDATIKPGMFARVNLVISEKSDVIVVPRDCLVERGEDRTAYVVVDGKIQIREVEAGISNKYMVEIISGLEAGETVVSGGQAMLAEGQQVKPVSAEQAAAGKAEATTQTPQNKKTQQTSRKQQKQTRTKPPAKETSKAERSRPAQSAKSRPEAKSDWMEAAPRARSRKTGLPPGRR